MRLKNFSTDIKNNYPLVDSKTSLWGITRIMRGSGKAVLPIVENERLLGVVQEKDIKMVANYSSIGGDELKDILCSNVLCVVESARISDVLDELGQQGHEFIIVQSEAGHLLEILSPNKLLQKLTSQLNESTLGFVSTIL